MRNPEYDRLTDDQVSRSLKALRAALKRMREIVRDGRRTEFDQYQALQKKQAIEREVHRLERELTFRVQDAGRAAVPLADALNPEAPTNPLGVSATVVARAQADAAQLVRGVSQQITRELNQAVVKATTGERTRAEFEADLADILDEDLNSARVERIVRTELGQIFQQQGAEADARLAEDPDTDMIKVWRHKCGGRMCRGAREDHVAIHGQERELWEDFDVDGGATAETPPGGGQYRANRPLDPKLPAKHKINCGCSVVRRPRYRAKQSYIAKTNPRVSSPS